MKPLPKRRRTSDPASHDGHDLRPSSPAPGLTGTGTDPSQESHDEADDHTPATPDPTLAAQLALQGDGAHAISLDQVTRTMRDTGRDMLDKYKETSLGGLAVSFTEC